MTNWEWSFLGSSVFIVLLDHAYAAARRRGRRARAVASRKLGNKFATDECLLGSHVTCNRVCGECGYPCSCDCHASILRRG